MNYAACPPHDCGEWCGLVRDGEVQHKCVNLWYTIDPECGLDSDTKLTVLRGGVVNGGHCPAQKEATDANDTD